MKTAKTESVCAKTECMKSSTETGRPKITRKIPIITPNSIRKPVKKPMDSSDCPIRPYLESRMTTVPTKHAKSRILGLSNGTPTLKKKIDNRSIEARNHTERTASEASTFKAKCRELSVSGCQDLAGIALYH